MGWKYCFCSNQILSFLYWCLSWVSPRFIFWSFLGAREPSWPIFVVRFKEKRWYPTLIQRRFRLLLLCCTCVTFGRTGGFFKLRVSFWDWFEAFHEWVNWGLDCNRWECFLIFEFSVFWSVLQLSWLQRELLKCKVHKWRLPMTRCHIFHCNRFRCSRFPGSCKAENRFGFSLKPQEVKFWRHSNRQAWRHPLTWKYWQAWYLCGECYFCGGSGGLNKRKGTFSEVSNDFPDEGFAYSELPLFSLVDNFAEVPFIGVFHKDVDVLFWAVEEAFLEPDDVGVVQRSEDSDLIGGVVFFVVAEPKTFDLNRRGKYLFHSDRFLLLFFAH